MRSPRFWNLTAKCRATENSLPLVTLRQAKGEDAVALSRLAAETFRDGWAALITHAIAEAYVAEAFTVEKVAEDIADPTSYVVLAVDAGGTLVGYARVATAAKAVPDCVTGPQPVLLQRLYVTSAYQGQGVADLLLADCVREALLRGGETLWLETEPGNRRAWRFYEKRGFVDVGSNVYALPGGVNDRIRVLQKRIVPSDEG
jgi:ribosomal protein S18 acetylase RimI-like enzyme